MGCRHVQAFLGEKTKYELTVLEPSQENIKTNSVRIGSDESDFTWITSLDDLNFVPDLVIVATSSKPRFNIVKQLLDKGVKTFLLEKIVFQSKAQFTEILDLMKLHQANAWCNFVNRYFKAYQLIKNEILNGTSGVEMSVYGGAFGLGCNAIHYIDVFQFLSSNNEITLLSDDLKLLDKENRRGAEYKEFTGTLKFKNSNGNVLTIIADEEFKGGSVINIKTSSNHYLLSEETQQCFNLTSNNNTYEFKIIPTSRLSNVIAEDILNNACVLTRLSETKLPHFLLFDAFNSFLKLDTSNLETLCPIT